ncbi:hypothetical protein [Nocardia sp. NPDC127526]|uniref:hypothetical protein n=1 Tax=Nocardia sp. NPDC127526 TaxID=3345393 RepID=UPI003642B51E
MAEKLQGEASQVRATATVADTIRDELLAIADAARAAISVGATAWGDDEFGSKFADGGNGFHTGGTNMVDGTGKMAGSFGNLVDGLTTSAERLEAMERGNTDKFK